jgi:DNA-binding LacI/PurR family transcriptional regulator
VAGVPNDTRALNMARYDTDVDYLANPALLPQPVRVGVASKFVGFGQANPSLIHAITKRGLPFVHLGTPLNLPGVVTFSPDYPQASIIAIEHLASLGHKQIAIASGPFGSTEQSVLDYNRGVRMAFEKLGLALETQHLMYGDLTFAAGVAAADILLARKPAPTAIYCLSDAVAAGVIAKALLRGVRVPEQLSVVGCGGDPVSESTLPALTTVHLPYEEMGQQGVSEADRLTHFDGLPESRNVTLPVRLLERDSASRAIQA